MIMSMQGRVVCSSCLHVHASIVNVCVSTRALFLIRMMVNFCRDSFWSRAEPPPARGDHYGNVCYEHVTTKWANQVTRLSMSAHALPAHGIESIQLIIVPRQLVAMVTIIYMIRIAEVMSLADKYADDVYCELTVC